MEKSGTLSIASDTPQNRKLFDEANKSSEHEKTKGFGHLDPLVEEMPSSQYQDLLHDVGRDECEGLVNKTLENINEMVEFDVESHAKPLEASCADRVVRKVESEILGCCGRTCGWNKRTCTAWHSMAVFYERRKGGEKA